ncbi:MAG: methyltransferase domain-containing protein, partial [Deltaproteobacteria bacterium]|nr:methyltransferase domain-containing protein [Deltaproteobacteria bacterium]
MKLSFLLVLLMTVPGAVHAQDGVKRDDHQMHRLHSDPKAYIGASGYFTFHLARHIGEKGKVYAVDVSPDMILHVNRRIRELKTNNVVTVLADPDDPLLPDRLVNRFFFSDSWHHIENQTKYLSLMKKMLKPRGEVVIIDFHKKELPFGPPMQMKIAREDLMPELSREFIRQSKANLLVNITND